MSSQPVVTVFCASSHSVSPIYIEATEELAHVLVSNGYAIKYGGGGIGLMGALANRALLLNGDVIGIIPQFMVEAEWQHPFVKTMVVTETMHQRKKMLLDQVEGVVVLPGSTGTLEELSEVLSLKKLGLFDKPIIIVNTNGFYNAFIEFIKQMVVESFMIDSALDLFIVVDSPSEVALLLQSRGEDFNHQCSAN